MTFDRLIYVDGLKDAGVAALVARAHAEALRDARSRRWRRRRIQPLESSFRADLQAVENNLRREVQRLDTKIEITARGLTSRGAGGLIVLATRMIGLKLFG